MKAVISLRRFAVVGLLLSASCKLSSRDDALGDKNPRRFDIGHAPAAATVAAEDIDVSPNGAGLPAGGGTAAQGAQIFAASCASCHGANGEGKPPAYPQLVGGPKGSFNFASDFKIPRTIGNYWPYATSVFDYIRRAMPLTAPGSLTADQTYAVTAFLLNREGLIPDTAVMNAKSLPVVNMPAKSHFVRDDRAGSNGGKNVR
jgi:mono/diheme cytochrome c family protein